MPKPPAHMGGLVVATVGVALGSAGLWSACAGSGPSPTRVPLPAPGPVGVVYEHTKEGGRPLAGFTVRVWWSMESPWDTGSIVASEDAISGADGSYTLPPATRELLFVNVPYGTGFHAPCPPRLDATGRAATTMDIHVASDAVLSSTGTPSSLPRNDLTVRGNVTERTSRGTKPSRAVSVRLTSAPDDAGPHSSTLTDASGNFVLCSNVPGSVRGDRLWLRINKDGYRSVSRAISIGEVDRVSLELIREVF